MSNMDTEIIIAIFGSVLASSGLWTFINNKSNSKSNELKLLLGIGYFYLTDRAMHYLNQGYISQHDYDYFFKYLAEPYVLLGGNGVGAKLIDEIKDLPIK